MPLTVRDIAKIAGVSPATVSRYFSGSGVVSKETARKIEDASKELHYIPRFKKCKDNGVIAVLIPNLQLGFYGEALKELIEEIPKYNYRIVFIPTTPDSEHYKIFFKEMNIVGVIYFDEFIDRDIINYISSKKIKTVMFAGGSLDSRSEMVHINDIAAAYEGTKYLISLGHEKIIILSDFFKNIGSSFQRFTGCKRALDEIGVDLNENEMLGCGTVTYETGYRLTKQFLDKKTDFTAIFAFSDEMAMGGISALHDYGLKVPEDVSVLGFDDIALASRFIPRLTTIHQPIKEFVARTLEAFQDLDNTNDKVEITLPYKIVKRDTCAANKGVNIYEK